MLVSLVILGLYFWAFFADVVSVNSNLLVSTEAAVLAGIALFAGFVSYLWTPRKQLVWSALATYGILVLLTAVLVLNTGATHSPFVALWMLVSVFAGVFGLYALGPLFVALAVYSIVGFLNGSLTRDDIFVIILAGEVPLGVSYLIWHRDRSQINKGDQAYRELASELSEVAGKSEVVINAIADGVIAVDNQGIIELINPAAQHIIGWGKQDALRLNYKSVLKLIDAKGSDIPEAADPVALALASNKQTTSTEFTIVTNSGKNLLASIVVSPVGQPGSGVIIVFRDITAQKTEERQQAEFISTASHEMRTPVASIEGYLGLALNPQTAQIDDKAREFILKAHESAQHLGRLFQDLLDVSKADDGRLSNNPKIIDAIEFTHDIVEGLRPKADEKHLVLTYKPKPDDVPRTNRFEERSERTLSPIYYVDADPDHLREVLANLVENAIKYTPNGHVTVDITGDEKNVTFSIADTGIGIPKEDVGHLFQKFYRIDSSETREIGGTGLGLYLCRRLTEAMNGRIWVESEYKQGSTFFVSLPRLANDEATRRIEQAANQSAPEISDLHVSPQPKTLPEPAFIEPTLSPEPPQPATPTSVVANPAPAVEPRPAMTPPTPTAPSTVPSAPVIQPSASNASLPPPVAAPPAANASPAAARINVPISFIEQNKDAYVGKDRGVTVAVPPRDIPKP